MSELLQNKDRERRKQYEQLRHSQAFSQTAEETTDPIRAKGLWRYTPTKILILGTNDNLYIIIGRRRYKLKKLEQPLDKIWTPQELYFMTIAKELNITPEEAHKLSQELHKADEAEFMSKFSEIAKERGITLEEAYEETLEEASKQYEEFLKHLNEERITRMKKLIQFRKGEAFAPYKAKDTA